MVLGLFRVRLYHQDYKHVEAWLLCQFDKPLKPAWTFVYTDLISKLQELKSLNPNLLNVIIAHDLVSISISIYIPVLPTLLSYFKNQSKKINK